MSAKRELARAHLALNEHAAAGIDLLVQLYDSWHERDPTAGHDFAAAA